MAKYGREKLDEGDRYLQFVKDRVNRWGLTYWAYNDPIFQIKGESLQGIEVKLDNPCLNTGQLSIEVAEKSDGDLPRWTESGIFKRDNSWCYIQGNYKIIFVFSKKWLLLYQRMRNPPFFEWGPPPSGRPTVRKFYMPLDVATKGALFVLDGKGNRIDE